MAVYARTLTEEERAKLEDWQSNAVDRPALQQRAHVILLSSRGIKAPQIARDVGLHALNVRKWIHRFNQEGLDGLHDRPRCGRPPKVDLGLRRTIWEIVATDPRDLGCPHDAWTATRLMDYLCRCDLVQDVSYELVRQLFREAQIVVGMLGQQTPGHSSIRRLQPQREPARQPAVLKAQTT